VVCLLETGVSVMRREIGCETTGWHGQRRGPVVRGLTPGRARTVQEGVPCSAADLRADSEAESVRGKEAWGHLTWVT